MIIGSGLLAANFSSAYAQSDEVLIYAAGVSNSACTDCQEFERERALVVEALRKNSEIETFVYFSTCSVQDPDLQHTPYVVHKRAMEGLISAHPGHLVFRLPQVAGRSNNPHTLLNFLFAKIRCGERFTIWGGASRNVIDVIDVYRVARYIIDQRVLRQEIVNIANSANYSVRDIVSTFELVCGKAAIFDVIDKGKSFEIDVSRIAAHLRPAEVEFGASYLHDVLNKYYGR
jgi:nucleoside-diphosphate-sugar epimerase